MKKLFFLSALLSLTGLSFTSCDDWDGAPGSPCSYTDTKPEGFTEAYRAKGTDTIWINPQAVKFYRTDATMVDSSNGKEIPASAASRTAYTRKIGSKWATGFLNSGHFEGYDPITEKSLDNDGAII